MPPNPRILYSHSIGDFNKKNLALELLSLPDKRSPQTRSEKLYVKNNIFSAFIFS